MSMEKLFDLADEYDAMLNQGIKVSGESKEYFIHGRISDLRKTLPADLKVLKILDYGCGIGETSSLLKEYFKDAEITGVDLSEEAIEYAEKKYAGPSIKFDHFSNIPLNYFDLVYVNGVFHHIEPKYRIDVIKSIHSYLKEQGVFALFENNPWNIGTRIVMKRIKFDRDAQPINPMRANRLVKNGGFEEIIGTRYLFYFPKVLSFLRFTEKYMAKLLLGAQYYVLARKR